MTWLLTGGAGYIGAHVVRALAKAGRDVVVLDDLSTGFREFVPDDVPLVEASILDTDAVRKALGDHDVQGVIHLGALKYAGISVDEPLDYYRVNVEGTRSVLAAMADAGVDRLVFSSSASVYGTPDVDLVTEDTATRPESPYGESKLVSEWLIADVARASGLRHTSLRYFNVVGTGGDGIYDINPYGLLPAVMKALTDGRTPVVNGTDYPTRDGTAERDYIHVVDLAEAHVAAAQRLAAGKEVGPVYNLGRGEGATVLEVLDLVKQTSGIDFEPELGPRRPGDPARIVAAAERAARDLGWTARFGYPEMVESAWTTWQEVAARQGS
jgi:UDP-glucose 4-epimerase